MSRYVDSKVYDPSSVVDRNGIAALLADLGNRMLAGGASKLEVAVDFPPAEHDEAISPTGPPWGIAPSHREVEVSVLFRLKLEPPDLAVPVPEADRLRARDWSARFFPDGGPRR